MNNSLPELENQRAETLIRDNILMKSSGLSDQTWSHDCKLLQPNELEMQPWATGRQMKFPQNWIGWTNISNAFQAQS